MKCANVGLAYPLLHFFCISDNIVSRSILSWLLKHLFKHSKQIPWNCHDGSNQLITQPDLDEIMAALCIIHPLPDDPFDAWGLHSIGTAYGRSGFLTC